MLLVVKASDDVGSERSQKKTGAHVAMSAALDESAKHFSSRLALL